MLIWLHGNPNPQELGDRMTEHPTFRHAVFSWMEDIIKCELPGMTEPLRDAVLPLEADCRIKRPPQVAGLDMDNFAFVSRITMRSDLT
ncbi:hypothetical protein EV363DRAFT_1315716 [Boletus edulis]|nr:hypothetical protein EV363DRAFT_1315716 [Boletus edulis]